MLKKVELVSVENMSDDQLAHYMENRGFHKISIFDTVDASPSSTLTCLVHTLFNRHVAPLLGHAYDALKPAMLPNWVMPPDVVTLTDEKLAQYHSMVEDREDSWLTAAILWAKQTSNSRLVHFWNGVFSDLKPYDPRAPAPVQSVQPIQSIQSVQPQPVQSIEPSASLPSLPLPSPLSPVPSVDTLAEQQFFKTSPDYALDAGETLVVQFKPEFENAHLWRLDGKATVAALAENHQVYRLSDVHLTNQEVAELKKGAAFTLLVDGHVTARYDAKNEVVHFDTGLRAAFARALGGRKTTKDHYVVQPHNGSTQNLLDTLRGYELPVHAIDLRHGLFVFDGRYRLPPALLNSCADRHVVSTAVYGSGTPIYDIARRIAEARNASQPSSQPSPN